MTRRRLSLIRESFPEPPELDTAVSHATLRGAAAGDLGETLRLHRPSPLVAFGPRDRVAPGFAAAVAAARDRGFAPVERLAGGRAAVFHEGTLAFSWIIPDPAPRRGIRQRFETLAEIVVAALRSMGVDARMGELPGEYCPGEHSVNARGRTKIMGVGQRIIGGAAHVGGVVVVTGVGRVREILLPVYEALELEWDPGTAGSLEQELPGVRWGDVERVIIDEFAARFYLEESATTPETLELARRLAPRHALD